MPRFLLCHGVGLIVTLFPVFARERQQGDMTGTLDGTGHFPLMFCACAGLSARTNFAIVRDEALEKIYLFIVYYQLFVRAELAELRA